MKKLKFIKSFRFKSYITVLLTIIFLCSASMLTTYLVHAHTLENRYLDLQNTVAQTVKGMIDPSKTDSYINGSDSELHIKNNIRLRKLTEDIGDIYSIGVYKFTEDGMYTVFDTTSDHIRGGVGEFYKYTKDWEKSKRDFLEGNTVEDVTVHFKAGNTSVYCMPVYETAGGDNVYVCVGVLEALTENIKDSFFRRNSTGIIAIAAIFLIFSLIYIEFKIARPIQNISALAKRSATQKDNTLLDEMVGSEIKTVGEIENISKNLTRIYSSKVRLNSVIESVDNNKTAAVISIIKRMDNFYALHLDNSSQYMMLLTAALRDDPRYKERISQQDYDDMLLAAPFHDIGKLVIPNHIINKPGPLTDEEYEIIKEHTELGAKIVEELYEGDEPAGYLKLAREIALHHHERWDGTGYPDTLAGEEISLLARIVSVVDVFDALVSKRVYKEAYSFDKALALIKEERGKAFDPDIVDKFLEIKDKIYDMYIKINEKK